MTPQISSRCMAIANMLCIFWRYDPFCFSRSTGNHEVVCWEIKPRKCEWSQEHTEFMPTVEIWNFLEKTRFNIPSSKYLWTLWEINRGINIRIRKELHQSFKYPLRTTPMSNPVGHKSYFFLWNIHNTDSIEIFLESQKILL